MGDGSHIQHDMVVLLPPTADLPPPVRERAWQTRGSVHLANDPVEALINLASCQAPRSLLVLNAGTWADLAALRQSVARYWPDATIEVVEEMEEIVAELPAGGSARSTSGRLPLLARPVAGLSRRGRLAINTIAIALLLSVPIIWLLVLHRGE